MSGLVANFSASFFFIAWITGQFVRVGRQQTVEERLQTIQSAIQKNLEIYRREMETSRNLLQRMADLQQQLTQHLADEIPRTRLIADIAQVGAEANTHLVTANTIATSTLGEALSALEIVTGSPILGRPKLTSESE